MKYLSLTRMIYNFYVPDTEFEFKRIKLFIIANSRDNGINILNIKIGMAR